MEHSAILLNCIKLPTVFKTFDLSFFGWPLKTGFTVPCFFINTKFQANNYSSVASVVEQARTLDFKTLTDDFGLQDINS